MSYSIDLRERVLLFIEKGGSKESASKVFSLGRTTVYKWINKKASTGKLNDGPRRRKWKKIDPTVLLERVKEHPDYTLTEYAKEFGTSLTSLAKALKKLKITLKKRQRSTVSGMKKNEKHS